ncbi:MAG: hypothetical protein ACNA7K_03985 [Acholeplasmataceae bacterium]
MRFYTAAPANLGYTYTNFDLVNVSKVVFSAAGTNGLDVIVSVSTDGGTTWINQETFELGTSAADFVYLVDEALQTGNLRLRFEITFETAPGGTSRLYIDDVRVFS